MAAFPEVYNAEAVRAAIAGYVDQVFEGHNATIRAELQTTLTQASQIVMQCRAHVTEGARQLKEEIKPAVEQTFARGAQNITDVNAIKEGIETMFTGIEVMQKEI